MGPTSEKSLEIIRRRLLGVFRRDLAIHENCHVDTAMAKQRLKLIESAALSQEVISESVTKSIAVEFFFLERNPVSDLGKLPVIRRHRPRVAVLLFE